MGADGLFYCKLKKSITILIFPANIKPAFIVRKFFNFLHKSYDRINSFSAHMPFIADIMIIRKEPK